MHLNINYFLINIQYYIYRIQMTDSDEFSDFDPDCFHELESDVIQKNELTDNINTEYIANVEKPTTDRYALEDMDLTDNVEVPEIKQKSTSILIHAKPRWEILAA